MADLVGQLREELFTCGICKDAYKDPKCLPNCHHSFCLHCLKGHVDIQQRARPGSVVSCPLCRMDAQLPAGGVEALNANHVLTSLGGILLRNRDRSACDGENQLRDSEANGQGQDRDTQTDEQKTCHFQAHDKAIISCCATCKAPLCVKCLVGLVNGSIITHRNHKICELAELSARFVRHLEDINGIRSELEDELQHLYSYDNQLQQERSATEALIRNRKAFLIEVINRWEQTSLRTLNLKAHTERRRIENYTRGFDACLQTSKTLQNETEDLMEALFRGDTLAFKKLEKLDIRGSIQRIRPQFDEKYIDFKLDQLKCFPIDGVSELELEDELLWQFGRVETVFQPEPSAGLSHENRYRPITPVTIDLQLIESYQIQNVGNGITGFDIGQNDELCLVDQTSNQILICADDGSVVKRMGQSSINEEENLSDPWGVVVFDDGCIAVTDGQIGHSVKFFDADGTFMYELGSTYMEYCSAVAINHLGQLVVGDVSRKKVFVHEGTHRRRMLTTIKDYGDINGFFQIQSPFYIATNCLTGDIIISDTHDKRVKVFTSRGQFRFHYSHFTAAGYVGSIDPVGVCSDAAGRIFVLDKTTESMHILSADGMFLNWLPLQQLLTFRPFPHLVKVDRAGNLVLVSSRGHVAVFSLEVSPE